LSNLKKYIHIFFLIFFLSLVAGAEKEYVSDILFEGNTDYSAKTLKKYIRLKSKGIFRQSTYNSRVIKLDVISIKTFYLTQGYMDVDVTSELIPVDEQFIDIKFIIKQGKRYRIKSIEIFGNRLYTKDQILNTLAIKRKDYYNPAKLIENLDNLEYDYLKNGKLLVSIADEIDIQEEGIDVRINISEGHTYNIGRIAITGLERKPEKYVKRELKVKPGQLYDISKIEKSQNRIFSSGLFSSVAVYPTVSTVEENTVDIEIRVREYQSRNLQFDFGIGQEPSTLGEGAPPATVVGVESKWQPGTILNTANRIEVGAQVGLRIDENISYPPRDFYVNWFSPWVFGTRIPVRLKYYYEELKDVQAISRQGVEISLFYKQGENYNYTAGLKFEDIRSDAPDSTQSNSFELDRKIDFSFFKQKLNDFIRPTSGYFYSVSLSLNGTILGGNKHYLKFDTEYKKFWPIKDQSTFGHRFKFGYLNIFPQSDLADLDFYDKFWLGGNTSLRGWKQPKDFNEEGSIVRLQYNAELRFPIIGHLGGEIFFDGGRLADEFSSGLLAEWSWDTGAGLTYHTPIGPIRLDFAYPDGSFDKPTVLLSLLYMF